MLGLIWFLCSVTVALLLRAARPWGEEDLDEGDQFMCGAIVVLGPVSLGLILLWATAQGLGAVLMRGRK